MKIRKGGADDIPAILGMLDGAIEWLVAEGRTGQWGTKPWSSMPKAVEKVHRYVAEGSPWIAEVDGVPAGTLTLTEGPGPELAPADEPERYIHLLVIDRRFAGLGVGSELLRHAAEETRREGISLLRVDCYAGPDGELVAYYVRNGFSPTEKFSAGEWRGQVLARRL
ncbi:GNAT family N-acetyltransferase [Streptomyces sp. NPDC050738]|uniref:GNAT family N-acetyltransferase n=1 Tax=Streptomyces sp. NPDC050738 TaxID=3154744 RepID=UPI00343C41E1